MGKTLQIKKLEGVICGLVRELEKLAPYPDRQISLVRPSDRKTSLRTRFNNSSLFTQNLPRRIGLERRLMACRRRLNSLRDMQILPVEQTLALAA